MDVALLLSSTLAVGLLGLGAGVHLSGVSGLNPALRSLEAPVYVPVKQAMDRSFPVVMRPLTLAGIVAAGATCVLAALAGEPRAAALGAGATVSALVALGAVLRGDLPINAAMAGWDGARPPADWRDQRRTWERWFVVRTGANAAAFAAALAALVALG